MTSDLGVVFLLDVNVLIALLDPLHVHHDLAHGWFGEVGRLGWATCPLTENAVLRIVGHSGYPGSPGSPATVAPLLCSLCALPGHTFWPDSISVRDAPGLDTSRLLSAGQITDTYLLALARSHRGRLATLDRRLTADAVVDGRKALFLID